MKLYLMQHGRPVPKEENPDRPLSGEGRRDVEAAARALKKIGVKVNAIFHSGKTRARETAEIVAAGVGHERGPTEKKGLSPKDDVRIIAGEINRGGEDLMIAGHLPHLGRLAALLVLGDENGSVVRFQQGGVVCLEKGEEGGWGVAWMLVPGIFHALG